MSTFSDEVSGNVVSIIVLILIGSVMVIFFVGSVIFGAISGLVVGGGVAGYRLYKRSQVSPFEEKADATGFGLFEPGGLFMGEEVHWD